MTKGGDNVSKKSIYVTKYIAFSFMPVFFLAVAMSAFLIFGAKINNSSVELILSIVITVSTLTALILYFTINIIRFLRMIQKQEKHYKTKFNDNNARIFSRHYEWIVLSDKWVFSPGKFAIYQNDIKSASIGETYIDHKCVVYPVRIKTFSSKVYIIKLTDEQDARAIRNWARQ